MKRAKDMLMRAETVLVQLISEQRPGFDLTWGYRSGTGTVFPTTTCAVSLSVRSVSAQGRYVCCVPVSSFCQCTGTVRVLCPCQFVLSVHRDGTCAVSLSVLSALHTHSSTIGTAQCCQLKAPLNNDDDKQQGPFSRCKQPHVTNVIEHRYISFTGYTEF